MRLSRNNSGIILLSVLWILAILAVLGLSLGRRTDIELALTKYWMGSVNAYAAARAGIVYAMYHIKTDSVDADTSKLDMLNQCGFRLPKGKIPADLFKNFKVSDDSSVTIGFVSSDFASRKTQYFGFQDEERKIDLNVLNLQNYSILSHLLVMLNVEPATAETIAASVVDWHDADDMVTKTTAGAETDDYERLPKPYRCKNKPFDQIEELLLVKGVTPEIFKKVKNYVTVYPHEGNLQINLNTATPLVLGALVRYLIDATPGMSIDNPDEFVGKLVRYRNGEDGEPMTSDDRPLPRDGNVADTLDLNTAETSLYMVMQQQFGTLISNFLDVRSSGADLRFSATSTVEAVIKRDDLSIMSWQRYE